VIDDFAYPLTFETGLPLAAPFVLATTLLLRRVGRIGHWLAWAGTSSLLRASSASSAFRRRCFSHGS
jgi:hypothetical protein